MTTTELWTVFGGIAGIAGLGLAIVIHIIRYAYQQGKTDQRLNVVERQQAEAGAVHSVLAALSSTVEGLKEAINRLDRALERMDERVSRTSGRKSQSAEG